jgi:hypothetical protein
MDCEGEGALERSGRGHFAPAFKNDSTEFTKRAKIWVYYVTAVRLKVE